MARQLTLLPNIGSWRISRQHKDAARRGIAACRAALIEPLTDDTATLLALQEVVDVAFPG